MNEISRELLEQNMSNPAFHTTFGTSETTIRKILNQCFTEKFDNLAQLKQISMRFDKAQKFPIELQHNLNHTIKNSDKFCGIVNTTRKELTCVAKSNYTIVQHKELVNSAIEALSALNISVYGTVENMGSRIYVKAFFKDKVISDDTEKGIHIGIRIGNSFDLSRGVSVSMYCMRLVCANQMVASNIVSRVVKKHVGEIDCVSLIKNAVTLAVNNSEKVSKYVNTAIMDSYEWEIIDKIVPKLFKIEKHKIEIYNRLKDLNKSVITRWDFYNCITQYATHCPLLSINVRENLERISEKVLAKPLKIGEN